MKNRNQRQILFIIGMHRSGTSALASLLMQSGLKLDNSLLSADEYNAHGYFESPTVIRINDGILVNSGYSWDNPKAKLALSEKYEKEVESEIDLYINQVIETSTDSAFVIKDPRLSITIPLWLKICEKNNITPKFILAIRNPLAVAKSLNKRNLFSKEKSYQLFLNYIFSAELHTRGYERCTVSFEDIVQSPSKTITKIFRTLNLKSNKKSLPSAATLSASIKTDSIHYQHNIEEIEYDLVRQLYKSIKHNEKKNKSKFDVLRASFSEQKKLHSNSNNLRISSQLFYDIGNGFNENDSIVEHGDLYTKKITYTLNQKISTNLKELRFDPSTLPVNVKIKEINAIGKNQAKEQLQILEYNGLFLSSGSYLFLSFDPVFIISTPKRITHSVEILLEYQEIRDSHIKELSILFEDYEFITRADLVEIREGNQSKIDSFSKKVEELGNKLSLNDSLLKEKNTQLADLSTIINTKNNISQAFEVSDQQQKKIIKEKNTQLNEFDAIINTKDNIIETFKTSISQQEEVIKKKNEQLTEFGTVISTKDNIIESFNISTQQHEVAVKEKNAQLAEFDTIINKKDDIIQNYKATTQQHEVVIKEKNAQLVEFDTLVNKNVKIITDAKNQIVKLEDAATDYSLEAKNQQRNLVLLQKELETSKQTIKSRNESINQFKKMLSVDQILQKEKDNQITLLKNRLEEIKEDIKNKVTKLKELEIENLSITGDKTNLQSEKYNLIRLLEMEQQEKKHTEEKLIKTQAEHNVLNQKIVNNQEQINQLCTQFDLLRNTFGEQINSITDLEQQLKTQQILIQQQQISLVEKDKAIQILNESTITKLRKKLSNPFSKKKKNRAYYPVASKNKVQVFFGLILLGLKSPIALLKNINSKNFKTLQKALKEESPAEIFYNLRALLSQSSRKKVTADTLGISTPTALAPSPQVMPEEVISENNTPKDVEIPDVITLTPAEPIDAEPVTNPEDTILYMEFARFESQKLVRVVGWAISRAEVEQVEIWHNGKLLGLAMLDIERIDVHYAYPDFPNSKNAGFMYEADVLHDLDKVTIRVVNKDHQFVEMVLDVIPFTAPLITQVEKRNPYEVWIENNTITSDVRKNLEEQQKKFRYRPKISIVIPVYNVDEKWLKKAIDSIKNQIYDNWELCLADDASPKKHVVPFLRKVSKKDKRIKVSFRKKNGRISAATNSALKIATGNYIAFMDNDDELAENALFEVVKALNKDKSIDVLYSDEDKITEDGKRYDPFFKPDWSPELLLSYNYFNHLLVVKNSIVRKVKGLRSKFDGAQDYDFILRIIEEAKNVAHIPQVLYHWRALEGSIAASGDAKSESFSFFDKVTGALQDYLDRNNIEGKAFHPPFAKEKGLGLSYIQWPDTGELVSIIIPSKNHYDTLKKCIDSLDKTTYQNYEVIIADNASDDKKTLKYLKTLEAKPNYKVLTIPNKGDKFSYSYINNEAVRQAKGSYVLLLNDDTEVITPAWLSQMVGYAKLEGVGIVGAKLLYPDNTIQHAGVLTNLYTSSYDNMPDHVFKNHVIQDMGYYFFACVSRNYSCVTAACLLISKEIYNDVKGLDEEKFGLAYNDVDLCLKVIEKGHRIVYAADAVLYHYESKSRKGTLNIEEVANYKNKWRNYEDPYYNPNLSTTKPFLISPFSTLGYTAKQEKVLIASHNLNFEGAPIQMLEIVEGLQKVNPEHQFEVYAPTDGPLRESYEKHGIKVTIFNDPVTRAILKEEPYEDGIQKFTNWIQSEGFTSVYANTLVTFFVHEACHKIGVKSLWGIHESAPPEEFYAYLGNDLKVKAYESFRYAYALVFVAKTTEQIFTGYDINQSSIVINNGLWVNRFKHIQNIPVMKQQARRNLGVSDADVLFLNLGTVCKRKGQMDFVIAAIDNIKNGQTNGKYVIVGARPSAYTSSVLQLITDNKLDKHFIIVEETGDVEQYYLAADVFTCTSYNESYPRVILEAMLFGLPIITTPIFGIKEQVLENINAFFYAPGNIAQLTNYINILATDHSKRKEFSFNAPYVFDLITSYDEMVEKYQKLV